ncbi:MAG: hypothetical protein ABS52_16555 [Gemmatimonadetes bacterium SCN 70-22]|nr:MAG: hypothetical protein ABS52_16555 [Gemmatimonadetes bacterium SCN 70-22]
MRDPMTWVLGLGLLWVGGCVVVGAVIVGCELASIATAVREIHLEDATAASDDGEAWKHA